MAERNLIKDGGEEEGYIGYMFVSMGKVEQRSNRGDRNKGREELSSLRKLWGQYWVHIVWKTFVVLRLSSSFSFIDIVLRKYKPLFGTTWDDVRVQSGIEWV